MAVAIARDCPFIPALADWFKQAYARDLWGPMVVFVPTVRAAGALRQALAQGEAGMLPVVLPLSGNTALAERVGMKVPPVCDAWAGRAELLRWLGESEPLTSKLWRQADSLWQMLNRLALHGLGVRDLQRGLPEELLGYWEHQAAVLLGAMGHMQRWLKAESVVLPGEAERMVLARAGEVLDGTDVVVAGVVDAPAPAVAMVKGLVAKGAGVVVPEAAGGYTAVVEAWLAACGVEVERVWGEAGRVGEIAEVVCEGGWDEAHQAALAVREAVARGDARVAVVSPARGFAAMVREELARMGIVALDSGAQCIAETAAGREVVGRLEAMDMAGEAVPVVWRDRLLGGVAADVGMALARVDGVKVPVSLEVYRAMVREALREADGGKEAVTPGVWILGALEGRMLAFDTVVVANMVEGVWPAGGQDAWLSEAHLRALGLADNSKRAALAAAEWQGLAHGGSGRVVVTRSRNDGEKELVKSRFLGGERVAERMRWGGERVAEEREALGVFVPQGEQWPRVWSASLVEDLLACPYKGLGERVLGLAPLDPLVPEPDARIGGLLAHRWLEMAGCEIKQVDEAGAEAAVQRLAALAEVVLGDTDAVVQALWRPRMKKLARALVDAWVRLGRPVAGVENRRSKEVGAVTVAARFDRVEESPEGLVIVDYKTGTPPSWSDVAQGTKPQLALEAWLLEKAMGVEFWQLRGYGPKPLEVKDAGGRVGELVAPVEGGVARLVEALGEGRPFPAVPDPRGGGLLATGVCETCALSGVCRRQAAR